MIFHSFSLSVPSTVKNIHVSANGATDRLMVTWSPGGGDVDSYEVSAFRQNEKIDSQTIPKHVSEHTFPRLEAGAKYRITIVSVSGSLRNQIDALGQTGEHVAAGEDPDDGVFHSVCSGTANGLTH